MTIPPGVFPRKFDMREIDITKLDDLSIPVISVEWRGPGDKWAVTLRGNCFNAKGEDEYEPRPSSRTEEFTRDFRFPLEEALELGRMVQAQKIREWDAYLKKVGRK